MKLTEIRNQLKDLPLGGVRFYPRIDSTNLEAARWAENDAPDLALVIAEAQSAGRGRQGRTWFTQPGSSLAFSVLLRGLSPQIAAPEPLQFSTEAIMRFTALGAVSICDALRSRYSLTAEIKWPNDILIDRRKTAGILAEAHWDGDRLAALILGIGINISPASVPPDEDVDFPATCLQNACGRPIQQLELLHAVLESLICWRERLELPEFLAAWEQNLAFKGEWVNIHDPGKSLSPPSRQGIVLGLEFTRSAQIARFLRRNFLSSNRRAEPAADNIKPGYTRLLRL